MNSYIAKGWKGIVLLLVGILLLAGCGNITGGAIVEGKVNVVTSFYPIYEFAKEIGGEDANVINLLPIGVEAHDWTPRSQDIINTSKAQLFLFNGAGFEGWVPNFLQGIDSKSEVKAVEVSKGITLIEVGEDDGHGHSHSHGEADADADHSHGEADHEELSEETADHLVDPHTWVSPKSAIIIAENIKNSFVEVDPAHKENYESRYAALNQKLKDLDARFTESLSKTTKKEIVTSHAAFGYLTRDYGLTQHAIMGLSPDAEPLAQDLLDLKTLVIEEGIQYIFFEELVSDKLANTLASETGAQTLVLNPLEGLTQEQEKAGETYVSLMEKNLQNLVKALQ